MLRIVDFLHNTMNSGILQAGFLGCDFCNDL